MIDCMRSRADTTWPHSAKLSAMLRFLSMYSNIDKEPFWRVRSWFVRWWYLALVWDWKYFSMAIHVDWEVVVRAICRRTRSPKWDLIQMSTIRSFSYQFVIMNRLFLNKFLLSACSKLRVACLKLVAILKSVG